MGSLLARVHFGRVGCGSDSGLKLFGHHGLAVARGLLDGPDWRSKAVSALLGRDRLVVAVVNDDVPLCAYLLHIIFQKILSCKVRCNVTCIIF